MSKPIFCRLEQLAHLGLPSQTFIPAILQELHHLIPSLANTFCWQDESGNLSNIYDERANTDIHEAFVRSIASNASDKYSHTIEWVSKLKSSTTSFENFGQCPFIAEFYKTIMLPAGYVNTCFIPVFHNKTQQRLGVLMVHRPRNTKNFKPKELENLQEITTLIAQGIEQASQKQLAMTDGWSQGLLLANKTGELEYACPMGSKLLALAISSQFNQQQNKANNLHVFNDFQTFINNISIRGQQLQHNNGPVLTVSNSWGQFQLSGFLLHEQGNNSQKIGITIRWQEPFVLTLFHRIKMLNLTARQETVGLLYAAGDQYQTIAEKLNLSLYTIKDHIKNISGKLKTNSRADLIELILCTKSS